MRRPLILAALLAMAACAPQPVEPDIIGPSYSDAPDQCRASAYQRYIGRSRTELPAKPEGQTWRVTCDTCPVTMDYNADRLNILYNSQTGLITKVQCG